MGWFEKRDEVQIISYYCDKCNKQTYFFSYEDFSPICKTCKNKMRFDAVIDYHPDRAMQAIKDNEAIMERRKSLGKDPFGRDETNQYEANVSDDSMYGPMVKCPYCGSYNTNKITGFSKFLSTALFGTRALAYTVHNFHCKDCGSDF